jgi:hypothetical protein
MAECIANFMPERNSHEFSPNESSMAMPLPKAEKILKIYPEG